MGESNNEKRTPCYGVLIRFRPDAVAGEQLNLGVAVWAPEVGFGAAKFVDDWARVRAAFPDVNTDALHRVMVRLAEDARAWTSGEIKTLVRTSVPDQDLSVQVSDVIAKGLTHDPEHTLTELYDTHVGKYQPEPRDRIPFENETYEVMDSFVPSTDSPTSLG